ncbi:MAG: hypothetical protein IPL39_15880 [Opitutaceae bacterium]|nr:hypothetical protein [Opitutaceae bacterium]
MAKANKRRHCPALGGEITPVDCGEDRNRRHACPMECPHNPFNPDNYDQLLEIEDRLDDKTMERLANDCRDRFALQRETEAVLQEGSGHAMHAYMAQKFFFVRDAAGLAFAQRWEKAGYAGLRNDERALFAAKSQTRVAALEVHRVIDSQFLEVVDLLAPERGPMLLLDRSLAKRAIRFGVLVCWVYPLPHFWRLSGTAILVPDMGGPTPEEVIAETLRHLGAPTGDAGARGRWLAENFLCIDASITATSRERRRLMMEGADAEWCEATYELTGTPAAFRQALKAEPEVDGGDLADTERNAGFSEAWVWFDDTKAAAAATVAGGRQLLGNVLLGKGICRIDAMGRARYEELRRRFEARMGKVARFSGERRVNQGAQLAAKSVSADLALVPPRLLENPMQLQLATSRIPGPGPGETLADVQRRVVQEGLLRFLDEAIPALEARTPRQAAADPQLRPKLVQLVKSRVRQLDEDNLRTGRSDDINGAIRELGLVEIDFPAPPPRDPPPASDTGEDEEDDEDFDDEDDSLIDFPSATERRAEPPPPRLRPPGSSKGQATGAITGELSIGEAADRMAEAMGRFETPSEALAELEASGSEMLEDLSALTAELISPDEFGILITLMLPVWFAMVPAGSPTPVLDYDRMEEAFDRDYDAVEDGDFANSEELMQLVLKDCPQPGMLMQALGHLYSTSGRLPKKLRPGTAAMGVMALAVKTVLTELDRSQRG